MTDEQQNGYDWYKAERMAEAMNYTLHAICDACANMLPRFEFRGFDGRENFVLGVTEDYCIMLTWWNDGYPSVIEVRDAIKIMQERGYLTPDDFEEV